MEKVAVSVVVLVDTDGEMTPRSIVWPDGREFPVFARRDYKRVVDPETGKVGRCYEVTIDMPKGYHARRLYRFGGLWYVRAPERRWAH